MTSATGMAAKSRNRSRERTSGRAGADLAPPPLPRGTLCADSVRFQQPTAAQILVTLEEIEPAVWRRLVVPYTFHLGQVHLVIQAAFGWLNYHLHMFESGGLEYVDPELVEPEFEDEPRMFDEREVRLCDFRRGEPTAFTYVYDFGDDWRHRLEIEQLVTLAPAPRLATCVAGARARPPEDVGGPFGYENFLEIIRDPEHEEHQDMTVWAGGHFDPEWFDLELCDRDVRRALRADRPLRWAQPRRRRRPPPQVTEPD